MKYLIICLLFFLSHPIHSKLNCSKNGTTVIYTNGILTSKIEANISVKKIKSLNLNNRIDLIPSSVEYILAYNYTESLGKDLLEVAVQRLPQRFLNSIKAKDKYAAYMPFLNGKMNDPSYSNDLNNISDQILDRIDTWTRDYFNDVLYLKTASEIKGHYETALNNGERVLAISHSQGGLFMRDAYNALNFDDKTKVFAGLQIASPLNGLPPGHFDHATHDKDRVINTLRSLFGALPSNLITPFIVNNSADNTGDYILDFFLNHGITSTYFYDTTIKEQVINKIISTAELLESNCKPPSAIINVSTNKLDVSFSSLDPIDPNAIGLTYTWNFGDGNSLTTTSKFVNHTYLASGIYHVSLLVMDQFGKSAKKNQAIVINGPGNFYYTHSLNTIEFTSTKVPSNKDEKYFYAWYFGDGISTSTTTNRTTHTYSKPGVYGVVLTVFDQKGPISKSTMYVDVVAGYDIPLSNFAFDSDGQYYYWPLDVPIVSVSSYPVVPNFSNNTITQQLVSTKDGNTFTLDLLLNTNYALDITVNFIADNDPSSPNYAEINCASNGGENIYYKGGNTYTFRLQSNSLLGQGQLSCSLNKGFFASMVITKMQLLPIETSTIGSN